MATEQAHLAAANRNQETINFLCGDLAKHAPWVATVAFYKALHIVEAVFATEGRTTTDHRTRSQILKTTRKYEALYRHFSPLRRVSEIARYLHDDSSGNEYPCFDTYAPPKVVAQTFLFHHLKQVENAASRFLSSGMELKTVDEAKPILYPPPTEA